MSMQKGFLLVSFATIAFVCFIVSYRYPPNSWSLRSSSAADQGQLAIRFKSYINSEVVAFLKGEKVPHNFTEADLDHRRNFDVEEADVFVVIRVQKTGSTFMDTSMIKTLMIDPPCTCRATGGGCSCLTKTNKFWMFSGKSTHWGCGLHADWTETMSCIDEWFESKGDARSRKDPIHRFFSEWQHVARGATWRGASLMCNGRRATLEEVPFCYEGQRWRDVTFEEFVGCPSNLAFNRMSRMFSDLTLVNCYNQSHLDPDEVNRIMLRSAKENLASFAFFFVIEHPVESQFLFERTFGVTFAVNLEERTDTHMASLIPTEAMKATAVEKNYLDISLYQFGLDLFWQRVRTMEKLMGYTAREYFKSVRKVRIDEDKFGKGSGIRTRSLEEDRSKGSRHKR